MIQFIFDSNNKALFAVLPIADYEKVKHLLEVEDKLGVFLASLLEEEPDELDTALLSSVGDIEEATIPHIIVKMIELEDVSPAAAWRKYRGFSQSEAASRLNIGQSTLSRMETKGATLQAKTKQKMASLYQCKVEDLL